MKKLYRIIDVNTNRACEGIRVLEDYFRFIVEDAKQVDLLRSLRHKIRKSLPVECIPFRNAMEDVGKEVSASNKLDNKTTLKQLLTANFVRVQEALRVLEEYYKLLNHYDLAKQMEELRFNFYDLEAQARSKHRINGVYAITSEGNYEEIIKQVQLLIEHGVKIIQYRDKSNTKEEQLRIARKIRELTREHQVTFVVNDCVQLANLVDADAIHVGQEDESVDKVRLLCPNRLVGVSTHNQNQFYKALKEKPDYIAVGPMYPTSSKEDLEACEGEAYAAFAVENSPLPIVAIGGIAGDRITRMLEIGVDAIAMIGALRTREGILESLAKFK